MVVTASLVAAALVAAVVLAAGGAKHGGASVVTGAKAYDTTVAASSAEVSSTFSLTTGNPTQGAAITESGPFSWTADQGQLTMKVSASYGSMTIQQIMDGNTAYTKVSVPGIPSKDLAGLPGLDGWTETAWTQAAKHDALSLFRGMFGLLAAMSGEESPSSILSLVRVEASSVTSLGGQRIDGTLTTHFRAHIPFTNLDDRSTSPAELQQAEEALGTDSLSVDYWIDSSDRLRRLQFGFTVPDMPTTTDPNGTSSNLTYPITMSDRLDLSDYGTPVHVTPPPPREITSIAHCVATSDGFNCSEAPKG